MNPQKALALEIDGERLCVACMEQKANDGGMPHLFYLSNQPLTKVVASEHCTRCGLSFGRRGCFKAADRITKILEGSAC